MVLQQLRCHMSWLRNGVIVFLLAAVMLIAFSQYLGGRDHFQITNPRWYTSTSSRPSNARYALVDNNTTFIRSASVIADSLGSLGFHSKSKDKSMPNIKQRTHIPYNKTRGSFRQQTETGGPTIVLILAYMHTGSSYLGELLQQHRGSFYLFEPLRSLKSKVNNNQMIHYLDGSRVSMNETLYTTVGAQSVVDMFSCDYRKLDIGTLLEKHVSDSFRGRDTENFNQCLQIHYNRIGKSRKHTLKMILRTKSYASLPRAHESLNSCLPNFLMKCENSYMRVIKMIRMSMDMAELALQKLPNIRIIHLLRDPRAMIDSNARKGELNVKTFNGYRQRASYMCNRMAEDLKTSERLKRLYSGQIFTLQYEEMVKSPMDIAKQIYEYVQIPFTSSVMKFVQRKNIDAVQNSTVRANKWRKHIKERQLKIIEYECSELFEMLGYKKLYTLTNVRNATLQSCTSTMHSSY